MGKKVNSGGGSGNVQKGKSKKTGKPVFKISKQSTAKRKAQFASDF